MHYILPQSLLPAPNFGKTFGVFVTSGLNWNFEDTSSLSEIGRRGKRKTLAVWLALSKQMRSKGTGMDGWGMLLLRPMN